MESAVSKHSFLWALHSAIAIITKDSSALKSKNLNTPSVTFYCVFAHYSGHSLCIYFLLTECEVRAALKLTQETLSCEK